MILAEPPRQTLLRSTSAPLRQPLPPHLMRSVPPWLRWSPPHPDHRLRSGSAELSRLDSTAPSCEPHSPNRYPSSLCIPFMPDRIALQRLDHRSRSGRIRRLRTIEAAIGSTGDCTNRFTSLTHLVLSADARILFEVFCTHLCSPIDAGLDSPGSSANLARLDTSSPQRSLGYIELDQHHPVSPEILPMLSRLARGRTTRGGKRSDVVASTVSLDPRHRYSASQDQRRAVRSLDCHDSSP